MPEERRDGANGPPPRNRDELIEYLKAALQLVEAEDSTAGFLLRVLLSSLKKGGWSAQPRDAARAAGRSRRRD
jgi:hypothetical protein